MNKYLKLVLVAALIVISILVLGWVMFGNYLKEERADFPATLLYFA